MQTFSRIVCRTCHFVKVSYRLHKLTYLVLTCRKTPINQSINPIGCQEYVAWLRGWLVLYSQGGRRSMRNSYCIPSVIYCVICVYFAFIVTCFVVVWWWLHYVRYLQPSKSISLLSCGPARSGPFLLTCRKRLTKVLLCCLIQPQFFRNHKSLTCLTILIERDYRTIKHPINDFNFIYMSDKSMDGISLLLVSLDVYHLRIPEHWYHAGVFLLNSNMALLRSF